MMLASAARSTRSEVWLIPSSNMMSNSAWRNGGATLFLTTFTRTWLPIDRLPLLDRTDAADVEPERGVELERLAAGGGLRIAEHDADLLAQLIDEHHRAVGAIDGAGELPERLAHEPGLESHMAVAHLAFDFGLGHQRGHRVDDHDVHRAGAHQDLDDLERLLAGVRLRDQQILDVDAELLGVIDIERVLRVDVRRHAARLLDVGRQVQA